MDARSLTESNTQALLLMINEHCTGATFAERCEHALEVFDLRMEQVDRKGREYHLLFKMKAMIFSWARFDREPLLIRARYVRSVAA
jgi:hypothetical protein